MVVPEARLWVVNLPLFQNQQQPKDGERWGREPGLETIEAMNLSSPAFLSQPYRDIFVRNDLSEGSTTLQIMYSII